MVHSLKPSILVLFMLLPVWQRERAFQTSVNYGCTYRFAVPEGCTLNSSPHNSLSSFLPPLCQEASCHVSQPYPCAQSTLQGPTPICSVLTLKTPLCSFLGVVAESLAIIKSHSNHSATRFKWVLDFQWLCFGGGGDFWDSGWVIWWNPDTDVIRTHWFSLYDRNASHHSDIEVT